MPKKLVWNRTEEVYPAFEAINTFGQVLLVWREETPWTWWSSIDGDQLKNTSSSMEEAQRKGILGARKYRRL